MSFQISSAPDLIRGLANFVASSRRIALAPIMFRPTIALVLSLVPMAAFAQTDQGEQQAYGEISVGPDEISPDLIVVTANGSSTPLWNVGQAITVLKRNVIESRQTTSIADLLATTPGVSFTRNGGPGQPTAVRIRGAEGDQTLVLIDGVRANDPSVTGGGYDFGNLVAGNIQRIEVLRGPNSVPWGSQAIGGVINIVTDDRPGVTLRGEYGENDATTLSGNAGIETGPLRLSAGGGYTRDGGVSTYRFGTERDAFRQFQANARAVLTLSDDVNIDLRGNYRDARVNFDGFPPPFFTFADTSGYSTTKQAFGYGAVNARLGSLSNRLAFSIADTRRASYNAVGATPARFAGRIERFEYQGDWRASDAIRTVFGIEHETSRGAGRSTGVTSGYLQAIVEPVDALTLTGGIRVDDHRAYGTQTTFSANAAWRIGSDTIIRAAYGEGFKAPTLFQLYGTSFGTGLGNDLLKPENAKSYELGIEQRLIDGRLRFGVTAFQRDVTNQINFTNTPARAERPFGYYFNIDRTRTQGFEAFIEVRPDDRLTLNANYSLIDAKDRKTGLALIRRPRHSLNASIDWAGPVKLGADLRLVGDSADDDFDAFPAQRVSLDGHTLLTLRAAVPIGAHLEVYGRIENVFDATYETVLRYGTYGRNAHIGVRAKF